MNARFYPIAEKDFEALIKLFQEFAAFQKAPHKMVNTLQKMKEEKDFLQGFTIKDESGNIIGYLTCFFAYYTWIGKSLYVDDIFVRPEFRGKGFGTYLLKKAIVFAKENKCHKIRWQVSSWNEPAIAFYKTMGAEIDSIEQNCEIVF